MLMLKLFLSEVFRVYILFHSCCMLGKGTALTNHDVPCCVAVPHFPCCMYYSFSFFFSAGDSTSGQRAIYHSLGMTGIPIINVNNNCSTGSTALFMGRQLVQGGEWCALVSCM